MIERNEVDAAIANVVDRARDYAANKLHEIELEDQRPLVKRDAILRIVGTENTASGKPHSASSAEAIVETDAEYSAHRKQQGQAVVDTIVSRAVYEAAKYTAQLLVGLASTEHVSE